MDGREKMQEAGGEELGKVLTPILEPLALWEKMELRTDGS